MSQLTGVRAIMKDIIETLKAGGEREFINLSAGNPVILPQVEQLWRNCTAEMLASSEYGDVVCRYGSSQGYEPLIEAIANDFNRRYGLNLTSRNILITPGSQALYFYGANAFGGYTNNELKPVVLPLSPEYTGYGGVNLTPGAVVAYQPTLEVDESAHRFKYRPDFERLKITSEAGCVILSRPSNPTGNLLSDAEVSQITTPAAAAGVPVFIDSAYGPPFPALNFRPMTPQFGGTTIHCISLSKAGLPGERIGIAIGDPELIGILESFQTNACIHSPRYGQAIAARAIASGALAEIASSVIRPYYGAKFQLVESTLDRVMPKDVPWFLHQGEGAIFAWLWLKDLPIDDWEFYQQLKGLGVIAVPGSTFFPGLAKAWPHKHQCLRLSLTADDLQLVTALQRLAQLTDSVYHSLSASA